MPKMPPTFRPGGKTARDAKRERDRAHDRRRAREQEWRGWYNTPQWRTVRDIVLTRDPACVSCLTRGRVEPSRVADHIDKEKKKDRAYFFNPLSCQGLCFTCHNSEKQRQESASTPKPKT